MEKQKKKLADYFPIIREREEIAREIQENPTMLETYNTWSEEHKQEFLDICTGTKGVKMLYDSYFKEIFNPEYDYERLSKLLSAILCKKVTVKQILPNDTTRIGDETSLIITDIVVELEDKTLANIEVQKIGYLFAGERASCYSADMLLRQYKRLRDQAKEHFSYKEIKPVYTIVLFENSPKVFKEYPDEYIHRFSTVSDTGLSLNMLQNYVFIPIDIFLQKLHNEGIKNELDAWLTFLGCDEPDYIIKLIEEYPYFKKLYADLYEMCKNVERMIEMFSKELQVLDKNTVKYMIDELQEELDGKNAELDTANATIADLNATITSKDDTIANLKSVVDLLKSENQNAEKEHIKKMLKDGRTSEAIVEFCDYPMELVLEVKEELEKAN